MRPARMFSDAPPSREAVTTSLTWADSVEVNTLTNSGMSAPASVPQEMIVDNRHHNEESPPSSGINSLEAAKVTMIESTEVSQTSEVKGASKFMAAASR